MEQLSDFSSCSYTFEAGAAAIARAGLLATHFRASAKGNAQLLLFHHGEAFLKPVIE